MITKTMLTLGMTLSLMSPLASYARMGTETSGGGDAVYINNQMVMRDLVSENQTQPVMNNLKFLDEIPEFRKLISAISKADPKFATRIVHDLLNANLYLVPKSLPILPYEVTTVSGNAADVQLAIRDGNSILIAPKFFKSSQQEFILLHEALHGVLEDNSGSMHHLRVRSIVKYIHDNINNLDSEELGLFLQKNKYDSGYESDKTARFLKEAWNKDNNPSLRCYLARMSTGDRTWKSTVQVYEKLNCLTPYENVTENSNAKKFLSERFPELLELKLNNLYLEDTFFYSRVTTFSVKKLSFFSKRENEIQKYNCQLNKKNLKDLVESKESMDKTLELVSLLNKVLDDNSYSDIEKEVLKDMMSDDAKSGKWDTFAYEKELTNSLSRIESHLNQMSKQQNDCDSLYSELK